MGLRFGLMCAGTTLSQWEAECVRELLRLPGVEPVLLIIEDRDPGDRKSLCERPLTVNQLFWRLYYRISVGRRSRASEPVDLSGELGRLPVLRCRVPRDGRSSESFAEADIEKIRSFTLDFILRFGFGTIRGEILEVPRLGVWSFHYGDEEKCRGGPPGFWEIYHGDAVTGAALQRLTDRPDGGIVLHKGYFQTIDHSWVRNRDNILFGTVDWPARICREILHNGPGIAEALPSRTKARVYRAPNNLQMLAFLLRVGRNHLRAVRRLFLRDYWNIGLINKPVSEVVEGGIDASEISWLGDPRKGRYRADPFGLRIGGASTILYEDYDYPAQKGTISALTLGSGGAWEDHGRVLELPVHASYPCLFEHEGEIYCVPETYQARATLLFKAVEFPRRWEKVATLIEGFAAVDPTVFRHDGRWWLLCTNNDNHDCAKLYAWHAEHLTGPWRPHPLNPLKCDVRNSRPAGPPFLHEGKLYRPAQDCSRAYGGAVSINLVRELSPAAFEEVTVARLAPDEAGPLPDGLHTLSPLGDRTLVDGKVLVFDPAKGLAEIACRLARARPGWAAGWPRRHTRQQGS